MEGRSAGGLTISRKDMEKAVPVWIKLLRFCPEFWAVVDLVDGKGDHCLLWNMVTPLISMVF